MGINLDTAAVTAVLKNRYTTKQIQTLAFQSPTVAMIPKDTEQGGNAYYGALRTATTSSVSSSAPIAFTTGTSSQYQQWVCPWAEKYGSANITGGAIDRAKGDANALVDAMVNEFDGAFITIGQALGNGVWNNGGEAMGQISAASNVATTTITLANINSIINIQPGYILVFSQTDGSATGGTVLTGTATVTAVDENAGTITFGAALNTLVTSVSATNAANGNGSYIFMQGSYGVGLHGIPGWICPPDARPTTGDSFNGVNRLVSPVRLAGNYYNGNGGSKRETMNKASVLVQRFGGRPGNLACNPIDYGDLENELGTNVRYVTMESYDDPQIGFPGIKLSTAFGEINIYQDPFVPQGYAWLLNFDEWLMPSMGDVPKVIGQGTDGLDWLRVQGDDAYQLRAVYRASLYCAAPGHQGAIKW
jgi:hypothetical protein